MSAQKLTFPGVHLVLESTFERNELDRKCLSGFRHITILLGGEELSKFPADKIEAFTCVQLKAFQIEDLDPAAAVVDYPFALERSCDGTYARSLHTEKVGQEFLGQFDLSVARTLAHNGEPPAHSRLDRVEMIADRSLGKLTYFNVAITKYDVVKNPAMGKELKNATRIYNVTFARRLHQSLIRHRILAQH